MNYKLSFIFLSITFSMTLSVDSLKCTSKSDDFNCRLTSMTPYRYIANYDDSEINFPGCEAKKMWLLIRHGTRYPSKEVLNKMEQLVELRDKILVNCNASNCNLTDKQLTNLANWQFSIDKNKEMALAEEGGVEMRGLAERYQSRFPGLMPDKYDNRTYKFKFTSKQRTKESAGNFTVGLFGKNGSFDVEYPVAEEKDRILRFYKACDKWLRDIDDNPDAYSEVEKFKASELMTKTLNDLSSRLGVTIDYDKAKSIRSTCAFETAWYENSKSPWCELLSPDEFQIMEFSHDLKYYWIDGYGYPLTYQHACTAIGDMFKFLETNDGLKVSAYFTHSGTLLKVLSLLGLARDPNPLVHNSYNSSEDRLWRVSLIDAFATNLAFISYECKSPAQELAEDAQPEKVYGKNDLKERSILLMHQERIVNLPGCPKDFPCPLAVMRNKYPDEEDECEFDKMCEL
ncbi:multiple inositol polyphosphate phosphatase 1-like [Microplitis mediator]|uniref:multiple inositol polyphosphate phosphatase 1-like n=1 Tax=Microplitis mediator TaxID=375433 RepID=UPI002553DEDC|nr:multiple inositol polyphosphate phosphatase 1-like [Microplitis mediator]